jgi:hypothetical protein
MVNLFCGQNGSGKTQKIISHANNELLNTQGLIVYIDKNDKYRLSINNKIKFINAKEFNLYNQDLFYGFLCGIISGNYDINRVYIDNLNSIINISTEEEFKKFISKINLLSQKCDVEFYFTMTTTDNSSTHVTELVYIEG